MSAPVQQIHGASLTNQRLLSLMRYHYWPIRGQYPGHVSVSTNLRSVSRSRDHPPPIRSCFILMVTLC